MKKLLFLPAIFLELLSLYILLNTKMTGLEWFSFLTLHAIACANFTLVTWLLLPNRYQSSCFTTTIFLFTFSFLIPLYGMSGILSSILIALYMPRKHNPITWQQCEEAALPQGPGERTHIQYGAGAFREILAHNTDPERRLLAVSAIRHLPRQQAVPLLQLALKDLSDDVRLLAYASLENIEAQINESISLFKNKFENKKQANIAFEIAQQYWEFCYLGLADGALRTHYLDQTKHYLEQSNRIESSASNNLLLGRVRLEQSQPEDAITYLTLALEGDLLKTQVTPYLAEAAYCMGNYKLAKQYIHQFPDRKGEKLSQIKAYWT